MAKHKAGGWKDRVTRENKEAKEAHSQIHGRFIETTTEAEDTGDLRLSPLQYRDPRELKDSPYNSIFEGLKNPGYWEQIRRDIEEAGAITDPLLITESGEIVSGHSRRRIALDLLDLGRREFDKIPVRVILSPLNEGEKRKRVYLGNLSRFEIDPNTRTKLYAEIYPEYFETERKRGQQTETVSVSTIAESMGVSERQARNERKIYQEAKKTAQDRGSEAPTVKDINKARETRNAARRKAVEPPITPRGKIEAEYSRAKETYKANGRNDYDAGIVEGLKRALELIG